MKEITTEGKDTNLTNPSLMGGLSAKEPGRRVRNKAPKVPPDLLGTRMDVPLSNESLTERAQLRMLLQTVKAVRRGDFSVRATYGQEGLVSEIAEVVNDIIELNENMSTELVRVSKIVGQEGKMTERASMGTVKGAWATGIESVNALIGDL